MCERVGEEGVALALPQSQSRASRIGSSNWGARKNGHFGSLKGGSTVYLCKSGGFSVPDRIG